MIHFLTHRFHVLCLFLLYNLGLFFLVSFKDLQFFLYRFLLKKTTNQGVLSLYIVERTFGSNFPLASLSVLPMTVKSPISCRASELGAPVRAFSLNSPISMNVVSCPFSYMGSYIRCSQTNILMQTRLKFRIVITVFLLAVLAQYPQ